MGSTSPSSRVMMILKASGTDWSSTRRESVVIHHETERNALSSVIKHGVCVSCRSFPNNYWDKFVKRKVSLMK